MVKRRCLVIIFIMAGFLAAGGLASAQVVDSVPPSPPADLSATLTQNLQIRLTWSPSADNVGVAGYYIYRNGIFITTTADTSFTDNSVRSGTYVYAVAAYDAVGNISARTLPSSAITITEDSTPPSPPTWLSVVPTTSSVALYWSSASDNVGIAGYAIYRNGVKIPFTNILTGNSYTDSNLPAGYTFTYMISAYDASGNTANSNATSVTTLADVVPPTPPFVYNSTVKSSSEIDLAWQASVDNVGVKGYYVYRNGYQAANILSPVKIYADTGLTADTAYSYTIAAYDATGNVSLQSPSAQATTLSADKTPPFAPAYIYARPISSAEIDLSWVPSTDNVGVAGYYVDRNGGQIVNTTSTLYTDTGLATSTRYVYAVRAYDAAGNVSPSSSIWALTLATPPLINQLESPSVSAGGSQSSSTNITSSADIVLIQSLQAQIQNLQEKVIDLLRQLYILLSVQGR